MYLQRHADELPACCAVSNCLTQDVVTTLTIPQSTAIKRLAHKNVEDRCDSPAAQLCSGLREGCCLVAFPGDPEQERLAWGQQWGLVQSPGEQPDCASLQDLKTPVATPQTFSSRECYSGFSMRHSQVEFCSFLFESSLKAMKIYAEGLLNFAVAADTPMVQRGQDGIVISIAALQ